MSALWDAMLIITLGWLATALTLWGGGQLLLRVLL